MYKPANIDIRLLQILQTIVDCGGFTPAEVELNLSATSSSNNMSDLETRLGMRLCRRGRGGFALTDEGRAVYVPFEQLCGAMEDFETNVGAARNHLTGMLNLVVIDGLLTGSFIGYLPDHFAQNWVQQGLLRPIRTDILSYEVQHKIISRKNANQNPVAKRFLEILQSPANGE